MLPSFTFSNYPGAIPHHFGWNGKALRSSLNHWQIHLDDSHCQQPKKSFGEHFPFGEGTRIERAAHTTALTANPFPKADELIELPSEAFLKDLRFKLNTYPGFSLILTPYADKPENYQKGRALALAIEQALRKTYKQPRGYLGSRSFLIDSTSSKDLSSRDDGKHPFQKRLDHLFASFEATYKKSMPKQQRKLRKPLERLRQFLSKPASSVSLIGLRTTKRPHLDGDKANYLLMQYETKGIKGGNVRLTDLTELEQFGIRYSQFQNWSDGFYKSITTREGKTISSREIQALIKRFSLVLKPQDFMVNGEKRLAILAINNKNIMHGAIEVKDFPLESKDTYRHIFKIMI